jgi:antitoxin (DNA-binding transcriptional repressor) of toxin-antitoxin stability system
MWRVDGMGRIAYHEGMQVTLHEAETNLAMLISAAERGEEVVISRGNKPVVEIRRLTNASKIKRSLGCGALAGYISDEMIEYLTNNPALDKEIEEDFMQAVDKPWPA